VTEMLVGGAGPQEAPALTAAVGKLGDVRAFEDIASGIASLERCAIPPPFAGRFDLLPERNGPAELVLAIARLVARGDFSAFDEFMAHFDCANLPDSHARQVRLVVHAGGGGADLASFAGAAADSRVSSLMQFALATTTGEPLGVLVLSFDSAVGFVKADSGLYHDFSLGGVLLRLCECLVALFAGPPLVPNAVRGLCPHAEGAKAVLARLPGGDDSCDFLNDDFDDLALMRVHSFATPELNLGALWAGSVDDLDASAARQPTQCAAPDAPVTAPFLLEDGIDMMDTGEFADWLRPADAVPVGASKPAAWEVPLPRSSGTFRAPTRVDV